MPRELKPPYMGGGVSYDILLRHPEFGAHIATVSHIWSMIEMHLADLMQFMGGNAALSIYLSMVSIDVRLSALRSVAKQELPDDLYRQFINQIQPELRKRGNERNRIAHARWAENAVFPDGIIMLPHFGDVFAGKKSVEL